MLMFALTIILIILGTIFATIAYMEPKQYTAKQQAFSNGVDYAKRNAAQVLSHEEAYNAMVHTLTAEERYHSSNQIGR